MNAAFGLRALVFFVVFVLAAVFDFFELLAMSSPGKVFHASTAGYHEERRFDGGIRP